MKTASVKSAIRHKGGPALLVLGATGAIGRGVVRAALDAGRPVIAVSPDADGLRDLQGTHAHADLLPVTARLRDEDDAAALLRALGELDRPIQGVVAALCTEHERGRLLDQPLSAMREALDANVTAHLAAARALLPLLKTGGRAGGYVIVDGPGGDHPWAGYGHRSVGAAALRMLARVLHDEARPLGVRLQMLSLDWPVRTDANARHACSQWPSAPGIGRRVLAMLDRNDREAPAAIVHCAGPCNLEAQTSDGDEADPSARSLHDARRLLGALQATPSPSSMNPKEDAV